MIIMYKSLFVFMFPYLFLVQRLLSNTEDECTFLRNTWEKSKEELGTLMERHKQV